MNYNENIAKVREMAALHNTGNVGGAHNRWQLGEPKVRRIKHSGRPKTRRGVTTAAVEARRRKRA